MSMAKLKMTEKHNVRISEQFILKSTTELMVCGYQ